MGFIALPSNDTNKFIKLTMSQAYVNNTLSTQKKNISDEMVLTGSCKRKHSICNAWLIMSERPPKFNTSTMLSYKLNSNGLLVIHNFIGFHVINTLIGASFYHMCMGILEVVDLVSFLKSCSCWTPDKLPFYQRLNAPS